MRLYFITTFSFFLLISTLISSAVPFSIVLADASTTASSDLQQKINNRNDQIKQLEEQLHIYNAEATDVGKQANTLKSTLKSLDLSKQKINVDLDLTQNKITKTGQVIDTTSTEIQNTQEKINKNITKIIKTIQASAQMEDSNNMLTLLLASKSIADAWNDIESVHQIQVQIKNQSNLLTHLENNLQVKQDTLVGQKKQLTNLQQDLVGKKQAVVSTEVEKARLLAETKNKQATYAQLIKTTEAQKAQFEKDVFDFESQLKLVIDQNGYPAGHHGILSWPVDKVVITQLFGKTQGAEKLYVSGSHNGVDFGASIGTRIKNVLAGTVVGTGNTDAYPGCYSFGKWVMVKHGNGLSTIYGHLSVISVKQGQSLGTGDLIGYSGNTGYSTGPHLHISVYATQGVRIEQFVNSRGCKQAIIPLADIKAYLDPMVYFPGL